jgi:hypothetical protein
VKLFQEYPVNSRKQGSVSARLGSLVLLATLLDCRAATYHVATNGDDAAPGTSEQPWRTINYAVSRAQPADTVRLGPGHYDEMVKVGARDGQTNAPITFDGGGHASVRNVSVLKKFICWKGFYCGSNFYEGNLAIVGCYASWCQILSNTIHANLPNMQALSVDGGTPASPFNLGMPQGSLIRGNIIENVGQVQAVGINGAHILFDYNIIRDCPNVEAAFYLWGVSNIIRGNTITNMNDTGQGGAHPDVFQSFADNGLASRGHIIEQNLIINCNCQLGSLQRRYKDQFLYDCQDWTFRNNLFVNVSSKLDVDFLNMKFYNNTFYNCMTNSPEGFILNFNNSRFGRADGGEIINNAFILVGNNPSSPNEGWCAIDSPLRNMVVKGNFVCGTDWSRKNMPAGNGFLNGGNPRLVRASNRRSGEIPDLHPLPGSPLLGAGLSLASVTNDFDGGSRSPDRGYTIGAFQSPATPRSGP